MWSHECRNSIEYTHKKTRFISKHCHNLKYTYVKTRSRFWGRYATRFHCKKSFLQASFWPLRIGAFTTPVLIITPLLSKFEYNATFTPKSTYFGAFCIKFEPKFEYSVTWNLFDLLERRRSKCADTVYVCKKDCCTANHWSITTCSKD